MASRSEISLAPVGRFLLAAAVAVAGGVARRPGWAGPASDPASAAASAPAGGPATAAEWDEAIRVVRQVALDVDRPAGQRVNAVRACVQLQLARGQAAGALASCRELLLKAGDPAVGEAALEMGCHVARLSAGHLGTAEALLEEWGKAAGDDAARKAVAAARADLAKARGDLMSAWFLRRPPEPLRPDMPDWGRQRPLDGPRVLWMALPNVAPPRWLTGLPGRGPEALQPVKPPVFEPPPWYGRLPFPPAVEPKKK